MRRYSFVLHKYQSQNELIKAGFGNIIRVCVCVWKNTSRKAQNETGRRCDHRKNGSEILLIRIWGVKANVDGRRRIRFKMGRFS